MYSTIGDVDADGGLLVGAVEDEGFLRNRGMVDSGRGAREPFSQARRLSIDICHRQKVWTGLDSRILTHRVDHSTHVFCHLLSPKVREKAYLRSADVLHNLTQNIFPTALR